MARNPKWHRDEIILTLDLYFDKNRGTISNTNLKIIELSRLLNLLPIFDSKPDQEKFRNPNGVTLKLSNFLAIDPEHKGKGMTGGSKLDKILFDEFRANKTVYHKIANEIKSIIENPKLTEQLYKIEDDELSNIDGVKEGQVIYKMHKVRERDTKIIKSKKEQFKKLHGRVFCERCGFDFEKTYGVIGKDFIECHHRVPLHNFDYTKTTKLDDLELLCSNCHRMAHRKL